MQNKRVRRYRPEHLVRSALLCGTAYALISCTSAQAQTVINVSDGAGLSAAIAQADSNASTSYVINFQNNITLSGAASDTLNAFNTTSNVTVNGGGFTLDGGSVQRGFFVYAGSVAINNLTIQNTQALGGSGALTGASAAGGGGGGGTPGTGLGTNCYGTGTETGRLSRGHQSPLEPLASYRWRRSSSQICGGPATPSRSAMILVRLPAQLPGKSGRALTGTSCSEI